MIRAILAAAPLSLALAACGSGDTATDAGSANTAAATTNAQPDYAERIRTMPEGQRTAVFLRAVRDAGNPCQTVMEATDVGVAGGPPTYAVRCDDGGRWVVAIGADGVATVTAQSAMQGKG